ncbi:MAG: M20/M25/M40 family metallo-hydrolase [Firmicutes bacterium]|nr:M20/M25/M40 family metallo-hydrolase [[Eubacterium] siraeum]MCM1486967.1 M20/M25/M40 family metallo-hydrolase [Bacillota bacterium]
MDITKILEKLCTAEGGVSGGEKQLHQAVLKLLKPYAPDAAADPMGNITAVIGEDTKKPLLLLDAHIDRIGMIVTHIDKDGFLKVSGIGMDRRSLLAQTVTVYGRKKSFKGIISTLPPHVDADRKKAPKTEDIAIDVGMTKEEAEKNIFPGDLVLIDGRFSRLAGTRVCSPATDDRAGVAAVLYALDLLKKERDLPFRIAVQFAAQEEVGCRGAAASTYNLNPDYAIAVDVSFAVSSGVSSNEAGEMGKGVMIGISGNLSRDMFNRLTDTAKKKKIPYQIEAMSRSTGTDADPIAVSRGGVVTGLLSIPQRYMHTPCEVLDTEDIKATGKLIAEFIKGGF